jgi:hypothetical protein
MGIVERLKSWKSGAAKVQPQELPGIIDEWKACFGVLYECALATYQHTGSTDALMALGLALESLNEKAAESADELRELADAGG